MNCPVCQTELEPFDYDGVRIHECPNCQGEWFDGDKLRGAIQREDEDLRWFDFALFEETGRAHSEGAPSRVCPRCSATMLRLQYEHSQVLIDKCERCGGVWLDRDELEALIKYLEEIVVSETASDYAREAYRQLKQIGAPHHGGIFSEIKDFLVVTKLLEFRWLSEHANAAALVRGIHISWPPV